MKTHRTIPALLTAALVSGSLSAAPDLTRRKAQGLALKEVPKGKIISAEREKEGGHDVWSIDVRSGDGKHLYELQYEVSTGKLVSRKEESKEEERKEAAQERKKKK